MDRAQYARGVALGGKVMEQDPKLGSPMGALPEIVVIDWKAHEKGSLRGFITVGVTQTLVVKGFKLFEKDGHRWVSPPAEQYKKRDGATGYVPVIEFTERGAERAFQEAVLADLDRYLQEHSHVGQGRGHD
jgi:hypothetical protein